jgi:hypothetical protein
MTRKTKKPARRAKKKCACTTKGWPNKQGHDSNCPLNVYTIYSKKHGISRFEAIIEMDGM